MFLLGDAATPTTLLQEILSLLTGGLSTIATSMGAGIKDMVVSIFLTGADTWTLNAFGTLVVIFAAVALSLSLFRWVLNFVTSWGQRNR